LWCGNNEIVLCNGADLEKEPRFLSEYEAVFHQTLPAVLAATDTATPYWPGSPWRGSYDIGHAAGEAAGDTHFWDVWHARRPVKDFERYAFRFVSEFGMQSLCSPETQATFCAPEDANIFGPVLKNHQKNQSGNQIIIDYLSRRYRFPRGQDELLHLSQLNQAYCVQTGIEHWRRCMPRTMGALYWQLNDCWPVASWSSIEFTGRWKALHHVARRAFAPALVTAAVSGDEVTIIGNYGRSTVEEVHVYTVYDAPEPASGVVSWDLFHLDGRRLRGARRKVALRYGESVRHMTVDLRADIARHGRESLVVRIALDIGSRRVSEDSVLLATPRFLALPRGRVGVKIQRRNAHQATLTFTSPVFLHRFSFDFAGIAHHADDNYFELYPKEPRSVEVRFDTAQTVTALRGALTHRSLVDTY
jgi:beta-mannosidase